MAFSFLIYLACLLATVNAARILAIFPGAFKSHFTFNSAVMKSLHEAGHHITLISPFPSDQVVPNYTMIDSSFDTFVYIGQTSVNEFSALSISTLVTLINEIDDKYCRDVIKLKEIQHALNSTEKLYDVMFIELLSNYDCYLPLADKLNIPVIGTVTLRSWKLADSAVGVPNNPGVIPLEIADSKPSMTFSQRLTNVFQNLIADYCKNTIVVNQVDQFYHEYFEPSLHYKKKISLVFYNNHHSLLPRQGLPNAIEIGGVHIKPAESLPQDLQQFIDEAEHGVILFTFGSLLKASTLPIEIRSAFVEAFAAIPQRVIWKFEEPIEGISDNVLLSKWVPQRDILDHKNVKAFISHCGQAGVYEAIYTGTPVVTTPVFVDQLSNAAFLENLNVGIHLDFRSATKDSVLNALNLIINDTRYYDSMQKLSHIFKDRPLSPQQSVVYWTEYVIRHNGAPHLQALGSNMPLYQYLLLDIIFAVAVVMMAACYTVFYLLKKVHLLFLAKSGSIIDMRKKIR